MITYPPRRCVSVSNMTGSLTYVLLAPLFGGLVDLVKLSGAYWLLAANFLVFALLLLARLQRGEQGP